MSRLERRLDGVPLVVVNGVRLHPDRIEGIIRVGSDAHPVYITAPNGVIRQGADPFVPLALLPALTLGADLRIDGPVAPETLAAADRVQALLIEWFPDLRRVAIEAGTRSPQARPPTALSLFSGGVDSFYTVLEHRDRLTHLLFVHGFDVPLSDHALRARVGTALRLAAAELERPLIEAETNLREFLDRYVSWELAFGSAITAVARALGSAVGEVYIPSSWAPSLIGSHPELDPLWTTSEQAFVHDGAEVSRLAKVTRIVASETAMRYLRVCWRNPDGAYNCGRCEKCLRTMAAVRLAGAADRCPTFPVPLDVTAVESVPVSELTWGMWEEMRRAAVRAGDEALGSAIGVALRRYRARVVLGPLRRLARRVPGARWTWARLRR